MSSNGNALDKTHAAARNTEADLSGMDDWLRLENGPDIAIPGRAAVISWCEAHAGLILLTGNILLWGSLACGFHFG